MLKAKNVSKRFGNIIALDDVSFDIEEGEFVYITGPSGSGKTTMLRLILRDLDPDQGEILLHEENILEIPKKQIPKLRQKIGVVFQDFKLLPERTVRENVEVALAVIGLDNNEWKERVEHVINLVGLSDRIDLFPSQLSGGELQRVSMARALVVNPKVILADEPTGNLDWDTADALMSLFETINKEGKTILMATHHQGLIEKYPKREIQMQKSKTLKNKHEEPKEAKEEEAPKDDSSEEKKEKEVKSKKKKKK